MFRSSVSILAAAAFAPSAAYAATTPIVFSVGAAMSQALLDWGPVIAMILTPIIAAKVPAVVKMFVPDSVITQAILVSISKTAGQLASQPVVSVTTSNVLIRGALTELKAEWPAIMGFMVDKLEPRVIAQMQSMGAIPASATAVTLGAAKAPSGPVS